MATSQGTATTGSALEVANNKGGFGDAREPVNIETLRLSANTSMRISASENDLAHMAAGDSERSTGPCTPVAQTCVRIEDVGIVDEDPAEVARRLYYEDGFDKHDVPRLLGQSGGRGKRIGRAFLQFFDFQGVSFDDALRAFLKAVYLHGETQQKMRVLDYFAERYHSQNPTGFASADACFRMTVAVVLLNTDLYIHKGESKLSLKEWSDMLAAAATEDKSAYDPAMVKMLYNSIRNRPLELPDSEVDLIAPAEPSTLQGLLSSTRRRGSSYSLGGKSLSSMSITSRRSSLRGLASDLWSQRSNSIFSLPAFLHPGLSTESLVSTVWRHISRAAWETCVCTCGDDAGDDTNGAVSREGVLQRKHLLVREYKRAPNRSWTATYAQLCGSTLFMYKLNKPSKRDKNKSFKGDRVLGHIIVRHAYCTPVDNPRRPYCFTLVAFDQSSYMFQATSIQDRDAWVGAMTLAAARFSATPLPAGLSSDPHMFRRPVFPVAIVHRSPSDQITVWRRKADEALQELQSLGERPPGPKATHWVSKKSFYTHELQRYRVYIQALDDYMGTLSPADEPHSRRPPLSPPAE